MACWVLGTTLGSGFWVWGRVPLGVVLLVLCTQVPCYMYPVQLFTRQKKRKVTSDSLDRDQSRAPDSIEPVASPDGALVPTGQFRGASRQEPRELYRHVLCTRVPPVDAALAAMCIEDLPGRSARGFSDLSHIPSDITRNILLYTYICEHALTRTMHG